MSFSPRFFNNSLVSNDTITDVLTILNNGGSDLRYEIFFRDNSKSTGFGNIGIVDLVDEPDSTNYSNDIPEPEKGISSNNNIYDIQSEVMTVSLEGETDIKKAYINWITADPIHHRHPDGGRGLGCGPTARLCPQTPAWSICGRDHSPRPVPDLLPRLRAPPP